MNKTTTKTYKPSALLQFIVNFIIPIVVLTRFSGESQLGPTKSLMLALAFPVAFEAYSVYRSRKLSMLSIIAIGGILITGAISLLGLSEGWLAIRRSAPYFAMSVALLVSVAIKHPIFNALLAQILDMEKIAKNLTKKQQLSYLEQKIKMTGYLFAGLLIIIGVMSYVLTRIVIISPTGTTGFNQEYAKLRVLSLPIVSLPLIVGFFIIILYLLSSLQKLTGLEIEEIIKKKK